MLAQRCVTKITRAFKRPATSRPCPWRSSGHQKFCHLLMSAGDGRTSCLQLGRRCGTNPVRLLQSCRRSSRPWVRTPTTGTPSDELLDRSFFRHQFFFASDVPRQPRGTIEKYKALGFQRGFDCRQARMSARSRLLFLLANHARRLMRYGISVSAG
jgi:hypothetical protein